MKVLRIALTILAVAFVATVVTSGSALAEAKAVNRPAREANKLECKAFGGKVTSSGVAYTDEGEAYGYVDCYHSNADGSTNDCRIYDDGQRICSWTPKKLEKPASSAGPHPLAPAAAPAVAAPRTTR